MNVYDAVVRPMMVQIYSDLIADACSRGTPTKPLPRHESLVVWRHPFNPAGRDWWAMKQLLEFASALGLACPEIAP